MAVQLSLVFSKPIHKLQRNTSMNHSSTCIPYFGQSLYNDKFLQTAIQYLTMCLISKLACNLKLKVYLIRSICLNTYSYCCTWRIWLYKTCLLAFYTLVFSKCNHEVESVTLWTTLSYAGLESQALPLAASPYLMLIMHIYLEGGNSSSLFIFSLSECCEVLLTLEGLPLFNSSATFSMS